MKKGFRYTINDYEITKDGKIINKHNNRQVKGQKNGKGYLRVSIGGKLQFVHRLVAEKYVPNPENKPQVNHKDGNKLNNNYDNLEWCNNSENRKHAISKGLHLYGENCPWSKLTKENVLFILSDKTHTRYELAEMFNVSYTTINGIKNGRSWKQLKKYAELSQNEVIEPKDKKPLG